MPRAKTPDLPKPAYAEELARLRVALVNGQYELREAGRAVLVTIVGDDRLGAAELYNGLHEWMDARYLAAHAYGPPDAAEATHPPLWRHWRDLPARGQVGVWLGGELQTLLRHRLAGELGGGAFAAALDRYRRFEALLAAEGVRCAKLWVHLPEREHRERAKRARRGKGDWRLEEEDWRIAADPGVARAAEEEIVARTDGAGAPWLRLDASAPRRRDIDCAHAVLAALRGALAGDDPPAAAPARAFTPAPPPNVLDGLDLSPAVPWPAYRKRLDALQRRLYRLADRAERAGLRTVIALQGWDAAGKGGAVRRLTGALDARDYRVVPIGAPSEEERRHPYLWRFWRRIPPAGKIVIFDRSWYGRVLVERVEGFASDDTWQRAYDEINDFEEQLARADSLVLKFWLHIDAEEQLRRFRAREATAYKKYKISRDDYRNRAQRPAYEAAVHDMIARTDTAHAPWHLVASNDKRWARLAVIESVCKALARATGAKRKRKRRRR